jgi:uncharacterized protein involved in response to NO
MPTPSLIQLPGDANPRRTPAFLAKGFRPFFLAAAANAVLAMLLWISALRGAVDLGTYFGGMYWHAHEMLFGFTVAVIAGFLLTAVANWTGRETAVGRPLAALVALWIAGRAAVLTASHLPLSLAAVIDLAFLPALAAVCARPILSTSNRRNYQFVAMLAALFVANLAMHLGALGVAPAWIHRGAIVAVDVIILMIVVMTARIVPMFTRNATGRDDVRNHSGLDRLAALGALSLVLLDTVGAPERMVAMVALVTGLLVAARSRTWGTQHTLRHPLLWILHAGHLFVAVGLLLRGLAPAFPALGPSVALHALTAGGIGLLTLGMMARVALGHSGRPLVIGRSMTLSFLLMLAAALIRVFGPLLGPHAYLPTMLSAGTLFAVAFAIYLLVYLPILVSPRIDGRPG